MPGESQHVVGEDGVRRAKKWLDSTTRVSQSWTIYDDIPVSRLEYSWPFGDQKFSYDLGGLLFGGEFHQEGFLVESKKYSWDSQGEPFDKFLAQSYVTLRDSPALAQHFMWITWTPFRIKTWNANTNAASVAKALIANGERVFDSTDPDVITSKTDANIVNDLVSRLWVIVLSDRQESLVISKEDRAYLMQKRYLDEEL
ncbi:MAG TPA: hypothetical protein VGC18_13750 [Lacisediminihabitans sp.]|uniref:hypothetical protein n=1 Tax=Lacisediminihabitans sp. TaxID=2787631 RepID=UPI002EDB05FA